MKVYFNTYSAAFQCPGGGEIQLIKSKSALERLGHEVVLFDQWNHNLKDADVIHQFAVQGGTYNLCAYAHEHKIPLVLSPILWLSDYIDQYPIGEIGVMMKMADVICPNSYEEKNKFLNYFPENEDKYVVTHNGVDDIFFSSVSEKNFYNKYDIRNEFALCVGNIEPRKNQLALIEAAKSIGLHVVLIGNVRDGQYMQDIQNKHSGCYTYLGYVDHHSDILRSAYAACNVFALPSLLETPGLAALEAAASGAPLLITKEGCTYEYFGDNAFYVDPKNTKDISQKLISACATKSDELKNQIIHYTWDKVAVELESAYLKAILSCSYK